ncbi:MAG: hypothetical protein JST82_00310 [Bacteroidetes bacterium]|nr:hypothetical protein [Bacteroidota bacterium]
METEARRAISPEGCKRSAVLCARSNEGVTTLAAFLPVSLENAIARLDGSLSQFSLDNSVNHEA